MKPTLLISLVLALGVAACGGSEGESGSAPSPATLLASALRTADETESFRSTFELRSDLGGERIEGSGELRSNADSTKARGPVSFEQDGEKVRFEMILLEDELYMRGPMLRDALPPGKQWLRTRDKSLAQQSLTPKQFVELLRDTPQVDEVGRETIRGRETVHLRGPLDIRKAAERVGSGPVTALVKRQPAMVDRVKPIVDVWIDRQDTTLKRMAMTMTVKGEPGRLTIRGDLLERDIDLDDVKAPAEGTVVDDEELEAASGEQ